MEEREEDSQEIFFLQSKDCVVLFVRNWGTFKTYRAPVQEKPIYTGARYSEDFLEFWTAYPRKVGKGAAWKSWQIKVKAAGVKLPTVLAALERQKRSDQWVKDGGQFVPHPSTWLNQHRWEDDLGPTQQQARDRFVY